MYNESKIKLPKSKESQVSDVSVCVTFVIIVDAESVDVLIIVSLVEAVKEPITTTLIFKRNKQTDKHIRFFNTCTFCSGTFLFFLFMD